MYEIKGKYSTARVMTDELSIDYNVYKQILGFVNNHVFVNDPIIMPDYHYGNGCCVGFTMTMPDKIIPNIVGVDIHCNMMYVDFGKLLNFDKDQWRAVDRQVRKYIPMAKNHHRKPMVDIENEFPWSIASLEKDIFTQKLNSCLGTEFKGPDYTSKWFFELCERIRCKPTVAVNSLGTLGGSNHFIEFGESQARNTTGCTVHSGSRNFGLKICNYWQNVAKSNLKKRHITDFQKVMEKIKAEYPKSEWDSRIKEAKHFPTPTGLEYLEGEDMYGYLHEMNFCGVYAYSNLSMMMTAILSILNLPWTLMLGKHTVHTIHNYISMEDFIIRKGAVRAAKGERFLVPFNMEDGILICEGKGNAEWNYSAPHGAGRLFGRKEIKNNKDVVVEDIRNRMHSKGIFASVLPKDEVKEAYKDPKFIETAIAPTATIIDRIKPVLPIKAYD